MAGPKLLDKKVVNAEVQTQRKQQIDIGLSLAKKVDVVRSSLEEETQKLEDFRTHTTKQVYAEIDGLVRQKSSLIQEIRDRQAQLHQLQIPLDAKWDEVARAQQICDDWEADLEKRQAHIEQEEVEITRLRREAELEMGRATDFKRRTSEALVIAESTLDSARASAADIRNEAHVTLLSAEANAHEVDLREKAVCTTEKLQAQKEASFIAREEEIIKGNKILADRRATLDRALARLTKH